VAGLFEDVLEGEAGVLEAALEGAGADVELAGYVLHAGAAAG